MPDLFAINHWDRAIETHKLNHPYARTKCESIEKIRPTDYYKPGELRGLWASPECTHHSVALGGKPINDQSRATAWSVVHWAEQLRPSFIWVENVPEFKNWGPLGRNNKAIKSLKGRTFLAWLNALESLGYRTDYRILQAADYGDPTTRRRLFIQAVLGSRKIVWPEPTHAKDPGTELFNRQLKPWVPASEIIDWSDEGTLLSKRKRPLADKTYLRIINGFIKHGINPLIVGIDNGSGQHVRPASDPLSTITTKQRHAVAKPFLIKFRNNQFGESINEPLSTVTAGGRHHGIIRPYLIPQQSWDESRSIDLPISTITTTTRGYGLVNPYMIKVNHGDDGRDRSMPLTEPLGTITTKNGTAVIRPYLMKYYGEGGQWQPVTEPLATVTTKERFALVVPVAEKKREVYALDFMFRMLNVRELAAAQGFTSDYQFAGTKTEIVKQIGNAVPRRLSRAIVLASVTQNSYVN